MLRNRHREKLIQAIVYLARNTRALGNIKLFKLLYLLDFEHFRQTGRSVTGMEYRAWKRGPVPIELMQEWDEPEGDLAAAITVRPKTVIDYERYEITANMAFDPSCLSKRELYLMNQIATRYRDTLSASTIDVTHAANGAWYKVWAGGEGNDHTINYRLAVADDDPNREAVLEAADELEAIRSAQAPQPVAAERARSMSTPGRIS